MAKRSKLDEFAVRSAAQQGALDELEAQLVAEIAEVSSELNSWPSALKRDPAIRAAVAELDDQLVETRRLLAFLRRLALAGQDHNTRLDAAKSNRRRAAHARWDDQPEQRKKEDLELEQKAKDIRDVEPWSRERGTNWLAHAVAPKLSFSLKPGTVRKRLNALKIR